MFSDGIERPTRGFPEIQARDSIHVFQPFAGTLDVLLASQIAMMRSFSTQNSRKLYAARLIAHSVSSGLLPASHLTRTSAAFLPQLFRVRKSGTTSWAHTGLRTSAPEDGAILNESPEVLNIKFREEVQLVEVALTDAQGNSVAFDFEAPQEKGITFTWSLPSLPAGDYRVSWTAMGGDTHNVRGEFSFIVK